MITRIVVNGRLLAECGWELVPSIGDAIELDGKAYMVEWRLIKSGVCDGQCVVTVHCREAVSITPEMRGVK